MLLKLNLSNLVAYRANFINGLVTSMSYGIFSFLLIILLTSRSPVVFGWKREELIFLMGVYNIVVGGFFHGIFSRNFDEFANAIDFGRLDGILLKPIDPQFLMSCTRVAFTQFSRLIMGVAVCLYIIITFNIKTTLSGIILFVFLSLFGIALLYSIWFSVMTLTVWNPRLSNLTVLMYNMNDLSRFPPKMYETVKNYLLFVIPYMLVIVVPTKAILQRILFQDVFWLLFFSATFFYLSRKFWQFALRSYTSASS